MRIRTKYIFFFLIFISLFGFGIDPSASKTSIKYLKESEWIAKPNTNDKVLKSIHFYLVRIAIYSNLTSRFWEKDFCISYSRKLIVRFLLQTRLYRDTDNLNLISIKRYIPRLFTDDHIYSY